MSRQTTGPHDQTVDSGLDLAGFDHAAMRRHLESTKLSLDELLKP